MQPANREKKVLLELLLRDTRKNAKSTDNPSQNIQLAAYCKMVELFQSDHGAQLIRDTHSVLVFMRNH